VRYATSPVVATSVLAGCSSKPEVPPSVARQLPLKWVQNTGGLMPSRHPVGRGMAVANSAAGLPSAFTGSVTIARALTDGRTGAEPGGFASKVSSAALGSAAMGATMPPASLLATKAAGEFGRSFDRC